MPSLVTGENAVNYFNNATSAAKTNDHEPYTALASKIETP